MRIPPEYIGTCGESAKLGSELTPDEQAEVKRRFPHRYTREHVPAWKNRPDCAGCPVQFNSDAEWLANTYFPITAKGSLSKAVSNCESHPTYPDGDIYQ